MPNDNCLTVVHHGKQEQVELEPHQAESLIEFLWRTEEAPRHKEGGLVPPERREEAEARCALYQSSAETLHAHLQKLAWLSWDELRTVMAFIELVRFGEGRLVGGNWILSFTRRMMQNVEYTGPAAALERDPRSILSELASDLGEFWSWMEDGTDLQKRHPNLFANPAARPTPPAAEQTTQPATKQPAKARKPPKEGGSKRALA